MPDLEPEILDGMRSYEAAQTAYAGVPDPTRTRFSTIAGWYDTSIDDNEGYFCMVQQGSRLEELIGDIVHIRYRRRSLNVYCIGGTALPTEIALFRAAYFRLQMLNTEEIKVTVQAIVREDQ
jgi:hypothetical protein